jgi:hypothetical protein
MELNLGCGHLNDTEFVLAFEECRLSPTAFHHADHVRLAWLYAGRYGAAAEEILFTGIRRFSSKAGVPEKFQHTTTAAWARLIANSREESAGTETFAQWIAAHPEFLDRRLLEKYYSKGRLASEAARRAWVEPDLMALG